MMIRIGLVGTSTAFNKNVTMDVKVTQGRYSSTKGVKGYRMKVNTLYCFSVAKGNFALARKVSNKCSMKLGILIPFLSISHQRCKIGFFFSTPAEVFLLTSKTAICPLKCSFFHVILREFYELR